MIYILGWLWELFEEQLALWLVVAMLVVVVIMQIALMAELSREVKPITIIKYEKPALGPKATNELGVYYEF